MNDETATLGKRLRRRARTATKSYRKRRSVKTLPREASVSRQQQQVRALTKIEV